MIFSPIILFLSILCLPSIVETDPNNPKELFKEFIKAATSSTAGDKPGKKVAKLDKSKTSSTGDKPTQMAELDMDKASSTGVEQRQELMKSDMDKSSSNAGDKPDQKVMELDMVKVRELQNWIGEIAKKVVQDKDSLFVGIYECQENFNLKTILENDIKSNGEKIQKLKVDDQKQFAQNLFSFGAVLSAEIGGPIMEQNSNYMRSLIKAFECVGGELTRVEGNTNVEWYDHQNSLFEFEIFAKFAEIKTNLNKPFELENVSLKFINEQKNNNIGKFVLLQALSTELSPFDVEKLVDHLNSSFNPIHDIKLKEDGLTITNLDTDPINHSRVWRQIILYLSKYETKEIKENLTLKHLFEKPNRLECIISNFGYNLLQRMEKFAEEFFTEIVPNCDTLNIKEWKKKFEKHCKNMQNDEKTNSEDITNGNVYAHYSDAIQIEWNIWKATSNQINEAISQLNRPNDKKKCLSTDEFEKVVKMLFKNNLSGVIMEKLKTWKEAKHEEFEKEQRKRFFHKQLPEKNYFENMKNWDGKVPSSATKKEADSMGEDFLKDLKQLENEEIIKLSKNIQEMCEKKIEQYQIETPFKINILNNQQKNYKKFYGFMAEIMKNFGAKLVKEENGKEKIVINFDDANKMMEKLEKITVGKIVEKDEKRKQFMCRNGIKKENNFENVIKEITGDKNFAVIKPKLDDLMKWEKFVEIPRENNHISRSEIEKAFPRKYANEWLLFNLLFSFGTRIVAYVHGKRADGTNANGEIDEKSEKIGHNRIQEFITVTKCFDLPKWTDEFSIFDSLIKFEVISSKEANGKGQTMPPVFGISIHQKHGRDDHESKSISKENFITLKRLHEQNLSIYEAIEMIKLFQDKAGEDPKGVFNTSKIITDSAHNIRQEFPPGNTKNSEKGRKIAFWQFFQHITPNLMRMLDNNAALYMSIDENKLLKNVIKNVKNEIDKNFVEILKEKLKNDEFKHSKIKGDIAEYIKEEVDAKKNCDEQLFAHYMTMLDAEELDADSYLKDIENDFIQIANDKESEKKKIEEYFEGLRRKWDEVISMANIELMKNIQYDLAINFEFNPSKDIHDRFKSMDFDEKLNDVRQISSFVSNEYLRIIVNLSKIEIVNYKYDTKTALEKLRELVDGTIKEQENELEKANKEKKGIEWKKWETDREKQKTSKELEEKTKACEENEKKKQTLETNKKEMENEKSKMVATNKEFIAVIEKIKNKETITAKDKKALQNLCAFTKWYINHNGTINGIATKLEQTISEQKKKQPKLEKKLHLKTKEEKQLEQVKNIQQKLKGIVDKIGGIEKSSGTKLWDIAEESGKEKKVDEQNKEIIETNASSSSSSSSSLSEPKQKKSKTKKEGTADGGKKRTHLLGKFGGMLHHEETAEEKLLNEINQIVTDNFINELEEAKKVYQKKEDIKEAEENLEKIKKILEILNNELVTLKKKESQISTELERIEREMEKVGKKIADLDNEITLNTEEAKRQAKIIWEELKKMKVHFAKKLEWRQTIQML